jgi:hypothetical protein
MLDGQLASSDIVSSNTSKFNNPRGLTIEWE